MRQFILVCHSIYVLIHHEVYTCQWGREFFSLYLKHFQLPSYMRSRHKDRLSSCRAEDARSYEMDFHGASVFLAKGPIEPESDLSSSYWCDACIFFFSFFFFPMYIYMYMYICVIMMSNKLLMELIYFFDNSYIINMSARPREVISVLSMRI